MQRHGEKNYCKKSLQEIIATKIEANSTQLSLSSHSFSQADQTQQTEQSGMFPMPSLSNKEENKPERQQTL